MTTLRQMAADTAQAAKDRAVRALRLRAHTNLDIAARAFADGDYELCLLKLKHAEAPLKALKENA